MFTHLIEVDLLRLHEEVHQCILPVVVVILLNEGVVHHLGEVSEGGMVPDRKVILQEAALDLDKELVLQVPGTVVAEACPEEVDQELIIIRDRMAGAHQQVLEIMNLVGCHRSEQSVLRRQ